MDEPSRLLHAIRAAFGEAMGAGLACFGRDDGALLWAEGACQTLLRFDPRPRRPDLLALAAAAEADGVLFHGVVTFQPTAGEFSSALGTVVLEGSSIVLLIEPLKQSPDRALKEMAGLVRSASVRHRDLMKRKLMAERRERLLARAREDAERVGEVDPLTGMVTRAPAVERLEIELRVAHRRGAPLSLLMWDLDHFEGLNEAWGPGVGDRVLAALGRRVRALAGRDEVLARMSGQVFLAVLPAVDGEGALAFADRVRAEVGGLSDDGLPPLTVSGGVATWHAGESAVDLLRRADEALHAAQAAGRDRILPWTPGS